MPYITTKVQALKSYATYQLYAQADPRVADTDGVFKICILETLRWIRSRLSDLKETPQELKSPEPQQYAEFDDEMIRSFSIELGCQIDVIYIESLGVWSFRIVEPDMGANKGTAKEREAVSGRTFTTEIAFRKQDDCVEIGVRTICSEPSDNTVDCEVFRPSVVKALAENADIRLSHCGRILDGKAMQVCSKGEMDKFFDIFGDAARSLPMILVADTKEEISEPVDLSPVTDTLTPTLSSFSLLARSKSSEGAVLKINSECFENKKFIREKIPKKIKKQADKPKCSPVRTKLPVFDYEKLAQKLVGLALVVFISDKYFRQIENKTQIRIDHGDIIVIPRKEPTERYAYSDYSGDMDGFFSALRNASYDLPKRSAVDYGNVLFYTDAKLQEYHDKRHQATTMEEKYEFYKLENKELKAQVKEFSQQQTDMRQTSGQLRALQKRVEALTDELDDARSKYADIVDEMNAKADAYRKGAQIVSFYKQFIDIAARFPTDKSEVCKWAEENFSDDIIIAPRAVSEMRKYSGSLDIASLCDGIVFLSAYARFRRQEIPEDELALYAQRCSWDVQGCGKEAMKLHRNDYTVTCGGVQYSLDLHIKHGIQADELIRIYFCRDDESGKIIIGSMPRHLATVKNTT